MNPQAQYHLATRLQQLRRAPFRPGAAALTSALMAQYAGALEAFMVLGAVSAEELAEWMDRGKEALEGSRQGVAEAPHLASLKAEPVGPQFVRLLPAPEAESDFFGGRLRILGLEIYDVQVVVLWRTCPEPNADMALAAEVAARRRDMEGLPEIDRQRVLSHRFSAFELATRFRVTDDVGTTYTMISGGGLGEATCTTGRLGLSPAPPREATALTIDALGLMIRLPLR